MKPVLLLILIFVLYGCTSENEKIYQLNVEKHALQRTIDSLRSEIAKLTRTPEQLIGDIKEDIKNNNLANARHSLKAIASHQFSSRQRNEISKLLSAINNKIELQDYQNLSETDTTFHSAFIRDHPKSRYAGQVRKRLYKLQKRATVKGSSYRQKKKVQKSYGTVRVGAICCDGTRSYATGRGACSHHGGVCQWLYR